VLTYVGTQVNFWIMANILLMVIVRFFAHIIAESFQIPVVGSFRSGLLMALALGLLYGAGFGITGYYLERRFFKKLSLGKVLLFKTLISVALFALVLMVFRFVLFDIFITPSLTIAGVRFNERAWDYLFWLLLIYYFFMNVVISFVNQVNKKYGPGVLLPLLLGRYSTPREEDRIFMFMDLKSSTATAEKLGHLKYSAFIRDCFADINEVLYPFSAQVYQYVGDEIVVTWPEEEGLREHICLRFFFAVKDQLQAKAPYYLSTYGFVPVFKAGLHLGKVVAVEIGEVKKDIAYHGDTLNTAARMQHVCNEYGRDFLVSEYLVEKVGLDPGFTFEPLGMILLKGKSEQVGIVGVAAAATSPWSGI
jgi:adenylate cyclase